jgi:hypothetical protein
MLSSCATFIESNRGMKCVTGAEIMGEAVKQLTDTSDEYLVERVKTVALAESDDALDKRE